MPPKLRKRSQRRRGKRKRWPDRWFATIDGVERFVEERPRRFARRYSWFIITVVIATLCAVSLGWLAG